VRQRLTLALTPAEGAVVRVLGLIERRGYVLRGVAMDEQDDRASLVVEVEPRDSGRRAEVVAEQLRRLIDVTEVTISPRDSGSFK